MAIKIALDTNAFGLCDTGHKQALKMVEKADQLFLPIIVYGELYYGFRHGTRFSKNLERLDRFIDLFKVEIIEIDIAVAQKFGDIYAYLRRKGIPLPTNDIWISACCQEVGCTLLTADRHFLNIEQIQVELVVQEV